MGEPKVKIIQRHRLQKRIGGVATLVSDRKLQFAPILFLIVSIILLLVLRFVPATLSLLSSGVDLVRGVTDKLSFLWSGWTLFGVINLGILLYWWMDYWEHRKPLVWAMPKTKYGVIHHLQVVAIPRMKYRFRPVFSWIFVTEVCALLLVGVMAWIGLSPAYAFSGSGTGTQQDPYVITTCVQLQEMRDDRAGYYILGNDIDCSDTINWNSGRGFIAIADDNTTTFTGTLDGQHHTIDGLYQRQVDSNVEYLGVLGRVNGAIIRNFKLTDVDVVNNEAGGMAVSLATSVVNSTATDLSASGSLTNIAQETAHVSGLLGTVQNSTISRISTNITLINHGTDDDHANVTAGLILAANNSNLQDLFATGVITVDNDPYSTVAGGLIGQQLAGTLNRAYSNITINIDQTLAQQGGFGIVGGVVGLGMAVETQNLAVRSNINASFSNVQIEGQGSIFGSVVVNSPPNNINISGTQNYFDQNMLGVLGCVGSYLDGSFSNQIPDQTPANFCTGVNQGNSQPNYFINNSTNPPFNNWDFVNVWKTQNSGMPIFTWQQSTDPAPPGTVRNLATSSSGSTTLQVTWLAPFSNGNSPIINYVVEYKLHSSSTWNNVPRSPSTTTNQQITGLTGGQLYDVRVAAVNAIGQGDWLVIENQATSQTPSEPQNLVVTGATPQTGWTWLPKLDWQVPLAGTPITDYVIDYKLSSSSTWATVNDGVSNTLSFTTTSSMLTDPGNAYGQLLFNNPNGIFDFRVAAINSYGQGSWSATQSFQLFVGITDCQQMQDRLNIEVTLGVLFKLVNNIDCSDTVNWNNGAGWDPVRADVNPFQGTFDGQGYTISDLYIKSGQTTVGLIEYAEAATIRNIILSDVIIDADNTISGPVAGSILGAALDGTVLTDIVVTGRVSSSSGAGGLVGVVSAYANATTWTGLQFNGDVTGLSAAGGLVVGTGNMDASLTISNSTVDGTVNSRGYLAGAVALAGILGQTLADSRLILDNVQATSTILGVCSEGAGGLIGVGAGGSIINSSYTGTITCRSDNLPYFVEPHSMAVDAQNQMYVVDRRQVTENQTTVYYDIVQQLSATGEPVSQWSVRQPGDDSGVMAGDIAIGGDGRIYITEQQTGQMRIFNASGQLLATWPLTEFGSIAVDASHNVYVASQSNDVINKYNNTGTLLWSIPVSLQGSSPSIIDLAITPNGTLYAAANSDITNLYRFNSNDGTSAGSPIAIAPLNNSQLRIATAMNNNLYANTGGTMSVMDSSGIVLDSWSASSGDIASRPDGDIMIVGTGFGDRLHQYKSDGKWVRSWGGVIGSGSDGSKVGGLMGYALLAPQIINSSASGQLVAHSQDGTVAAGGLIGGADGDPQNAQNWLGQGASITGSQSDMNIDAWHNSLGCGGLVGVGLLLNVTDSSATGSVTVGTNPYAMDAPLGPSGGLVGVGYLSRITDSSATGNLTFSVVNDSSYDSNYSSFVNTVGGLAGLLSNSEVQSSSATGNITVNQQGECVPVNCVGKQASATGGLVGALGEDILLSGVQAGKIEDSYSTGTITYSGNDESAIFAGGLVGIVWAIQTEVDITDSYSSSNIVVGGQDASAELGGLAGVLLATHTSNITVQNTYASGNIISQAQNTSPHLYITFIRNASAGGLVGTVQGNVLLEKSYATGNVHASGALGGLVGTSWFEPNDQTPQTDDVYVPTLRNTYSTSSVTGGTAYLQYGPDVLTVGNQVGGLVGNVQSGIQIEKSYASGVLANPQIAVSPANDPFLLMLGNPTTGGLVGQISTTYGHAGLPLLLDNTFTSTTLSSVVGSQKSALLGTAILSTSDQAQAELTLADTLGPSNYYDSTLVGASRCSNIFVFDLVNNQYVLDEYAYNNSEKCRPVNVGNQTPNYFRNNTTNPPLNNWDFASPIWYSHVATYPTFQPGETVPGPPRNLAGVPTTSSITLNWDPPTTDGGSPIVDYRLQYRLNGDSSWIEFQHSPSTATSQTITGLQSGKRYDFQVSAINAVGQSTWTLGIYDVLVPGNPPPPPFDPPPNPPQPPKPQPPTITSTETLNSNPGSSIPEEIKEAYGLSLRSQLQKSKDKTQSSNYNTLFPYFFISWLWVLALYYAYRAWKEHRYQQLIRQLLLQISNTEKAITEFLSITTHYLATPLSILKGAIELIRSKHALDSAFVAEFQQKLVGLQATTDSLITNNQQVIQASPAVVASDFQSTIKHKRLWLPLLSVSIVIMIGDIILIFTKSYNFSWGRLINHLLWIALGTVVAVLSYLGWSKQQKLHQQQIANLKRNRTLLAQKNEFVGQAAQSLTNHARQLRVGTEGLEKFTDTKLLINGLVMLDKLANSLNDVQRFSVIHDKAPNITISEAFNRDILPQLQPEIEAKSLKVKSTLPNDLVVQIPPEELTYLLRSIIQNAIQFSEQNGEVDLVGQMNHSGTQISIKNTGESLSPEAKQHLFEPLTRGVDAETFNHQGLGLSLYICRIIMQKQGGSIELLSTPAGTIATLTFKKPKADPTGFATQVIPPSLATS